jgi:hypothetical protein
MSRRTSLFSIFVISGAAALGASCGSGDKKLELGGACSLNSDCVQPLMCKFGSCHKACAKSVDCAAGEHCVNVDGAAVCQMSNEVACKTGGVCPSPLTCRSADNTCRNQCAGAEDCLGGQTCSGVVCIETKELVPVSGLDGGASDGPPASPDLPAIVPDAAVPTDLPAAPVDVAAVTIDTAGRTIDGGLVPPDLQATKWDSADSPVPVATATAVAVPTSARAGEEITVTVAGAGLTSPDKFMLGGVAVDKPVISGTSDVTFTAKLVVPHGITPSIVDLGFAAAGGQVLAPAVVQVTAIAAAATGIDTNRGTPDNPFRTFTKAVQTAGVGDTIVVGEGEYTANETWPALPDKVTVLGAGPSKTSFVGISSTSFTFAGDATVKGISFSAFSGYGSIKISAPRTTVLLEDIVDTDSTSNAGWGNVHVAGTATSAKVTVSGTSTVLGSQTTAIYLGAPYSSLLVQDGILLGGNRSVGNPSTVDVRASPATVKIERTVFGTSSTNGLHFWNSDTTELDLTFDGVTAYGQFTLLSNLTTAVVKNSAFTLASGATGIDTSAKSTTVSNTTFVGGKYQVLPHAGQLTVRNSKFTTYETNGILLDSSAVADLGTAADPGGNEFTGGKASPIFGLADGRSAVSPTTTVSATSFNGVIPPPGVLTNSSSFPVNVAGAYYISGEGNSITFF